MCCDEGNARKVRRLYQDKGAVDSPGPLRMLSPLFERFEAKLEKYHGRHPGSCRAGKGLAHRPFRRLEARCWWWLTTAAP